MITRSIGAIIRMLDADYIENADIEEKIRGVCIDSRKVVEGNLYTPIHGANNNGCVCVQQAIGNGTRAVLQERGEANPSKEIIVILVDDTTATLQQLVKAYRNQLNMKVVGVTGSNGKTSTKDILASVLVKHFIAQKTLGNYNNGVGVPSTLLSLSENCEVVIVEIGTEDLQELSFPTQIMRPDITTISNVGAAHLENLGAMENITRVKMEVTGGLGEHGLLIYDGDQQLLRNAATKKQIPDCIKIHTFDKDEQSDAVVHQVRRSPDGLCLSIKDQVYHLNMIGKHQAVSATTAWIAAGTLGLDEEEIVQGFTSVEKTGLHNELVKMNQHLILNDSYKSNPQSALIAVDTMEEFDVLYKLTVLGDMLESGKTSNMTHYTLGKDINSYHLQEVPTVGDMACYITQGVRDSMEHILVRHFTDKEEPLNYLRPYIYKECMLLMRGSRGMKLDEVMDELVKEQQ